MSKKLLIIEDQEKQRKILQTLVEEINGQIQIFTAENSAVGYRILMEHTIDVFLIDIVLDINHRGDTSGLRLAKEIRKIPHYEFTPIIFITSLEDSELYAYRNLHCYGYIEKPFEKSQVQNLIKQALHFSTNKEGEEMLFFRNDGILFPVKTTDIIMAKSMRRKLFLRIRGKGELQVPYKSCEELLEEADIDYLIQCNRNTIVNKYAIEYMDFTNRTILLEENVRVEIGSTYVKKLKRDLKYD